MAKFTDSYIRNLKPSTDRYEVFEKGGRGFGVRVNKSSRKVFILRYRFFGQQRNMKIGEYGKDSGGIDLKEARKRLYDALSKIEHNIDPGALQITAKQEEIAAGTVQKLVDEYIELYAKKHKRTWQEDERMLDKDVIPVWGQRRVKNIRRIDVVDLLDNVSARAPITANRLMEIIRKMFVFAIQRDYIEQSPCYGVTKPNKEVSRDRVLSAAEIKTFWDTLDREDTKDDENRLSITKGVKLALKLLLVTAQRRGEVATAEWTEIDLDDGWWTIPGEKAKNGLAHRVPLSDMAIDLLTELKELAGDSDYVLPSPRGGGINKGALTRAVGRNRYKFDMPTFTPHDLRRSAASQMASIGVPRLVISKILNHKESGVTSIYDRHSYDPEKREALDMWARHLTSLIEEQEAKVVQMVFDG